MEGNLDILSEPELSRAEAAALMLRTVLAEEGPEPEPEAGWSKAERQEARCGFCAAPPQPGKELMRCAGCKNTFYCSHKCQKAAWPSHKRECARLKKERKQYHAREKQARQRANKRLAEEQLAQQAELMPEPEPEPEEAVEAPLLAALMRAQQNAAAGRTLEEAWSDHKCGAFSSACADRDSRAGPREPERFGAAALHLISAAIREARQEELQKMSMRELRRRADGLGGGKKRRTRRRKL